jgi:hypothetical protein
MENSKSHTFEIMSLCECKSYMITLLLNDFKTVMALKYIGIIKPVKDTSSSE